MLLAIGLAGALAATILDRSAATQAAHQLWPPFVLVAGLLLLGRAAGRDGLFSAAGRALSTVGRRPIVLLVASATLTAAVTAVLNLDTAVVFVTPILLVAARHRNLRLDPFLYLAVFLANAGSLLLPGSNLTNLIVVGAGRSSSATFVAHMALPWLGAVVTTTAGLAVLSRRTLHRRRGTDDPVVSQAPDPAPATGEPRARQPTSGGQPLRLGVGTSGTVAAVLAMVVLPSWIMALVVLGLGLGATLVQHSQHSLRHGGHVLADVVDVPVLSGLFLIALALGVLGRTWQGPAHLLAHAGSWGSAGIGAAASVLFNNLPAAALLSAQYPTHPYALLIGLDIGPNLAVTGALSAFLWLQVGRAEQAAPSVRRYSTLGLLLAPAAMVVAMGALSVVR